MSHLRRRPGPPGPCSDEELVTYARQALQESPFHGEGYRKVRARLRFKGIRTSKERVRRLMREHGLQAPHRVGRRRGPVAHDGTITTKKPNEMWGTDMTATVTTDEGQAAVMVAVDHYSFEWLGIHSSKSANRFEALEPVRQAVAERLGEFGAGVGEGLTIRHDHGAAYLSDTFQGELAFPGIESRQRSSASLRVTAAPSDSSVSSRSICCGCRPSPTSRRFATRATSSKTDTIESGSSSVITT